jgi:hypothetical protein
MTAPVEGTVVFVAVILICANIKFANKKAEIVKISFFIVIYLSLNTRLSIAKVNNTNDINKLFIYP